MLDAVPVRPVAEGICLRLAVKIIFNKKEKRIEHIDDFFGCADSTLYNVLLHIARQTPKYLFDVPFFIETALARKTPSSPFDNGNKSANGNMMQPREVSHHRLGDSLGK